MPLPRRTLLLVAPLVGGVVGIVMSGVRYVLFGLLWPAVTPQTLLLAVLVPTAGLTLSGLLLQFFAKERETHDTEAYIGRYHQETERPESVTVKVLAAMATLGFGGAAGLEGPAVDAGSAIGRRFQPLVPGGKTRPSERRALLAAGAAAGVSAVFKTPLTGVLFALEVPFRDDVDREALIPSVLSSATAYLVAVALSGPEPLFPVVRSYSPDLATLLLSVLLGAVIGVVARLFVQLLALARRVSERVSPPLGVRAAGGGIATGICGAASLALFGAPLALSPGYQLIDATTSGGVSGVPSLWLFGLRSGAVLATLASGAAGGSFFPLLSLGAAAGGIVAPLVPKAGALLPLVGMAAFLSAGYGTPLTAAVFIAESTGAPGYVIPGLLGAAVAYAVSGPRTLSHLQRPSVSSRVEAALRRPVTEIMTRAVVTVPADTDVAAFIATFVVAHRRKSFPVTEGGRLVGMVSLKDVEGLAEPEWKRTPVRRLMSVDVVTAVPSQPVAEVLAEMDRLDIDRVPVVDPEDRGRLVGIVSISDIRPILERP